jgi:hypothetical protein
MVILVFSVDFFNKLYSKLGINFQFINLIDVYKKIFSFSILLMFSTFILLQERIN